MPCPVTGNPTDGSVTVSFGKRTLQLCSEGCKAEFRKHPLKYLKIWHKLRAAKMDGGTKPGTCPVTGKQGTCPVTGKNSAVCPVTGKSGACPSMGKTAVKDCCGTCSVKKSAMKSPCATCPSKKACQGCPPKKSCCGTCK